MLASSAYLASAASTRNLGAAILDGREWTDDMSEEILQTRSTTMPSGEESTICSQKAWERPLTDLDRSEVWTSLSDPLNRARLGAVSSPTRAIGYLQYP